MIAAGDLRDTPTRVDCPAMPRSGYNLDSEVMPSSRSVSYTHLVAESLAKKRLFFSSLPAMAEPDKRDQDLLTSNAADLLPVEMPWQGTARSPLFLFETPYRQLIPFSLFDPSLSDANMLVMAKSGDVYKRQGR